MFKMLLLSFGIAVLSGLGVGSGGLFVLYLTAVEHYPQIAAQGVNLIFFLFSAGAAVLFHIRHRRVVPSALAVLIPAGIVGCVGGAFLADVIDERLLRKLFGILLAVAGSAGLFPVLRSFFTKKTEKK